MNNKVFLFIYTSQKGDGHMHLWELDQASKEVGGPEVLDQLQEMGTWVPEEGLTVLRLPDLMPDFELQRVGFDWYLTEVHYITQAGDSRVRQDLIHATSERHALAIQEYRVRQYSVFKSIKAIYCKKK